MKSTLLPVVAIASGLYASGAAADEPPRDATEATLAEAQAAHARFDLPAIASPETQEPARLIVGPALPEFLARGLVVIQYRAENLRIVPIYGPEALKVKPRIGHIHVTVDDARWHWLDASGEPVVIQGLEPGPHSVRIDLADPTHRVIDTRTVHLEVPPRAAAR
jgi:hypothetical protein